MVRTVLAVIAGIVAWAAIAILLDYAIGAAIPGYHDAERTFAFTLPMQIARLALGAAASLGAGYTAALVAGGRRAPALIIGLIALALFFPMHIQLWTKFPAWYHAIFLGTLLPLTLLGAGLVRRPRA